METADYADALITLTADYADLLIMLIIGANSLEFKRVINSKSTPKS